jgi:hypothetical protein
MKENIVTEVKKYRTEIAMPYKAVNAEELSKTTTQTTTTQKNNQFKAGM